MNKSEEYKGLSLKMAFAIMLVLTLTITTLLVLMSVRTIQSFHRLSRATDAYIEMENTAGMLMDASDHLTEEVQCYSVLGERRHLENYFYESETAKRRESAIEKMEERLPHSVALTELKKAMENSVSLMEREYYAMKLVLVAKADANVPETLKKVTLSDDDMKLSAGEKIELARQMVHDEEYYSQKNDIREHLKKCTEELINGTHDTQEAMEKLMHVDLIWMMVFIALQTISLIMLIFITTKLGINPILRAVEHIKRDQEIPIEGANEFKYLAETYNNMYAAYKRSIEHLSFKASHDVLTGVYNRAGFELLNDCVDKDSTAVLLFDADNFKQINDEYGHDTGDKIIIKIAESLKHNFRSDDYIFRMGGDEFIVLMVHVDEKAKHLIKRKVEQINKEMQETSDGLPVTSMSAGVSFMKEGKAPIDILNEADAALYHVKENGRNDCCFYDKSLGKKS